MLTIRATEQVNKPKTRKKNWLGPSDNTIRDRIITELTSYNIQAGMGSDIDKTHKEIARQVYGMERMNRMNIPLIALVLALRASQNPEEQYDEHIDVYIRKVMVLKDIPTEEIIRDGLQIDIIRYNSVISEFIAQNEGVEYNEDEEEEEFYEDEELAEQIDEE